MHKCYVYLPDWWEAGQVFLLETVALLQSEIGTRYQDSQFLSVFCRMRIIF